MRKIKLFDPYIGEEEKEEIQKVLKSKYWASGSGNGRVKEFALGVKSKGIKI